MQAAPESNRPLHLYLSGGGFRASYFHLGALYALAAQNRLESLERISSVSGGSIAAGLFLAQLSTRPGEKNYVEAAAKSLEKLYWVTRSSPRHRALGSIRALARAITYDEFGFSNAMERLYTKWLGKQFHDIDHLSALDLPEWRIVTCDLLGGSRVLLVLNATAEKMPHHLLISGNQVPKAISASTALPFGFEPVTWIDGQDVYRLADGGILDNQGVREQYTEICCPVCVDASARAGRIQMITGWGAPTRAIDMLMDQTRIDGMPPGIELYELRQGAGEARPDWWTRLMDLRTDLDNFNQLEVSLLFLAGYQSVAGARLPESHEALRNFEPYWRLAREWEDPKTEATRNKASIILERGKHRWVPGLKRPDAMSIMESTVSMYITASATLIAIIYLVLIIAWTTRLMPQSIQDLHYGIGAGGLLLFVAAIASSYNLTGSRKLHGYRFGLRTVIRTVLAAALILPMLLVALVLRASSIWTVRDTGVFELRRSVEKLYGISRPSGRAAWLLAWRRAKTSLGIGE